MYFPIWESNSLWITKSDSLDCLHWILLKHMHETNTRVKILLQHSTLMGDKLLSWTWYISWTVYFLWKSSYFLFSLKQSISQKYSFDRVGHMRLPCRQNATVTQKHLTLNFHTAILIIALKISAWLQLQLWCNAGFLILWHYLLFECCTKVSMCFTFICNISHEHYLE